VLWNHINIWLLPDWQLVVNKFNMSIAQNIYNIKILDNYTLPPLSKSPELSVTFR
jgi:hypothetical protein